MSTPRRKRAVLFDLDNTLVITDALEPLRRAGDWRAVYGRFRETILPVGTPKFLQELAREFTLGVVTKSQRRYAEKLVAYHKLDIPVLIAYHDVTKQKPHPEGLLKAAAKLAVEPTNCIYIGDHADDIEAGRAANTRPILVCWNSRGQSHSECAGLHTWQEVLTAISQIVEE